MRELLLMHKLFGFPIYRTLVLYMMLLCIDSEHSCSASHLSYAKVHASSHVDPSLTIYGKIVDQDSNEPVSYASISIIGKQYGTVSNELGEFTFTIKIDKTLSNDTILIAMLGYADFKYPLIEWEQYKLVQLKSSTFMLDEVVVYSSINAQDIMSKVVDNIESNYPSSPYNVTAFFRTTQKENGKIVNLIEAALTMYDDGYKIGSEEEIVKLDQIRGTSTKEEIGHDRENKLKVLLVNNNVKYRSKKRKILFDKSLPYQLDSAILSNNNMVYVIVLGNKPFRTFKFFVDATNFSILRIEINEDHTVSDKNPPYVWRTSDDVSVRTLKYQVVVDFRKYQGKLYLNYISRIHLLQDFNVKTNTEVKQTQQISELVVNSIEVDHPKKIPKSDVMSAFTLNKQIGTYNADFWKNYNVIKLLPVESDVMLELQKNGPMEKQFSGKNKN